MSKKTPEHNYLFLYILRLCKCPEKPDISSTKESLRDDPTPSQAMPDPLETSIELTSSSDEDGNEQPDQSGIPATPSPTSIAPPEVNLNYNISSSSMEFTLSQYTIQRNNADLG